MSMRPTNSMTLLAASAALLAAACSRSAGTGPAAASASGPTGDPNMPATTTKLTVTSPGFGANQPIPKKYTGDGPDYSPGLHWSGAPAGTAEFALITDDPDAPRGTWVHWVLYKIPASVTELPENIERTARPPQPAGVLQGRNSWSNFGYGGPQPPKGHGTHHYHFKVYALDAALSAGPGLTKDELLKAMQGHITGEGELVGTYERR